MRRNTAGGIERLGGLLVRQPNGATGVFAEEVGQIALVIAAVTMSVTDS